MRLRTLFIHIHIHLEFGQSLKTNVNLIPQNLRITNDCDGKALEVRFLRRRKVFVHIINIIYDGGSLEPSIWTLEDHKHGAGLCTVILSLARP